MNEFDRPSILEANIIYFLLGLALLFLGSIVQSREIYSGLLITEYIIILLPNILYLKLRGYSLKHTLRLNKLTFKQGIYIGLIIVFTYPVAVFLNTIVIFVLNSIGNVVPSPLPIPQEPKTYLLSLFVIALSPGICEEIMFRGTIMRAYENMGTKRSIIYSSLLFGIFHLNLQNLLGPMFLGLILALMAHKTNSIFASILGHAFSNGIAMTISYIAGNAQNQLQDIPVDVMPNNSQMTVLLIAMGTVAYVSVLIVIKLFKKLPRGHINIEEQMQIRRKKEVRLSHFLPVVFVIALFIIINVKLFFL
ncbi:MAG: CPBP family intramembrane metalloprotease [Tissierellaceae bacterium]|nr:CPBP family intramembrane metalloprotease [Tissierellaceae bacterium]